MPPTKHTLGSSTDDAPQEVTVPSGQTCLARKPTIEEFLTSGIINQADSLTTFVQETIDQVEGTKRSSTPDSVATAKPDDIAKVMYLVNQVVCMVVVEPKVMMPPEFETTIPEGTVLASSIKLEDRMFLMEWALEDVQKLAPFREGSNPGVGVVRPGPTTTRKAKQVTRRK